MQQTLRTIQRCCIQSDLKVDSQFHPDWLAEFARQAYLSWSLSPLQAKCSHEYRFLPKMCCMIETVIYYLLFSMLQERDGEAWRPCPPNRTNYAIVFLIRVAVNCLLQLKNYFLYGFCRDIVDPETVKNPVHRRLLMAGKRNSCGDL